MQADLIIRGAEIIDGTGAPRRKGDVAVTDDRIVATGDLRNWSAGRVVGGKSRVVAPGFIDPHVHHDAALLTRPDMEFMTSQGVTTVINGNCGFSVAPLKDRLRSSTVAEDWLASPANQSPFTVASSGAQPVRAARNIKVMWTPVACVHAR